ncbi:MAG: aminotransferase class V-fold PLP-dependent enzyme [Lachnospiraceae bacterium]|nr:aminotransferase class V-fold PLP-dependent enzyme [Lachnospiraceae bacterium]
MTALYDEFKKYSGNDLYPCHMPGHKRHAFGAMSEEYASIDFTEVDSLDDLHDPEGIILESEKNTAQILGADESYFLINGSTAGILAGISASVKKGGKLLMVRGSHKSAYNAAYLRGLKTAYIYPKGPDEDGIYDAANADDVKKALDENPDAEAVFIVSPTYEGRMSDIASIAEAVHSKSIPLIVDEAHGAHLSFTKGCVSDAIRCGADIVIQSIHKTLPAPTQTAVLSVKGDLADRDAIRRFLSIYQSSSPSYPLISMIDGCIRYMSENCEKLVKNLHDNFENLLKRLEVCDKLICGPKIADLQSGKADYGKLIISAGNTCISGKEIADILRDRYRIETEMAAPGFVLAMFTVCDESYGYDKVADALIDLNKRLERYGLLAEDGEKPVDMSEPLPVPAIRMPISDAIDGETEEISFTQSAGRISSSIVCLYPPGTPIVAPGEEITAEHVQFIDKCLKAGFNVKGIERAGIKVVKNG